MRRREREGRESNENGQIIIRTMEIGIKLGLMRRTNGRILRSFRDIGKGYNGRLDNDFKKKQAEEERNEWKREGERR